MSAFVKTFADMVENAMMGGVLHVSQQPDGSVIITDGYRMIRNSTWDRADQRTPEAMLKNWREFIEDPALVELELTRWTYETTDGRVLRLFRSKEFDSRRYWVQQRFLDAFGKTFEELSEGEFRASGPNRAMVISWGDETAVFMPCNGTLIGATPADPTPDELAEAT